MEVIMEVIMEVLMTNVTPGVELTGRVVTKVQHLPHPDHHHAELGVPGSRLQGTAFPGGQGLLGTGLYHEDIVLPKAVQVLLKDIRKVHFISGSTVSVLNPLSLRVSLPGNLGLHEGQYVSVLSLDVVPPHEVEDQTGDQTEDWPGYHAFICSILDILEILASPRIYS